MGSRSIACVLMGTLVLSAVQSHAQEEPKPSTFTPEQIRTIREGASKIGYSKRRVGDVLVAPEEPVFSRWYDALSDAKPTYVDLTFGELGLENDRLHWLTQTLGMLPDSGDVDLRFELWLDTDDSAATGEERGSMKGVDRVVIVRLKGHLPFTGDAGSMTASIGPGSAAALEPPALLARQRFATGPDGCKASIAGYAVWQSIPLTAVGVLAPRVPFCVASSEWADGRAVATDESKPAILETIHGPRTTLTTSPLDAHPGDVIQASGSHFCPDASVKIVRDNEYATPLAVARADADGAFATSFRVPDLRPGTYFLQADDGKWFDFSFLTVKPRLFVEPSAANASTFTLVLTGCAPGTRFEFFATSERVPADLEAGALPAFAGEHAIPTEWGVALTGGSGTAGESGAERAMVTVRRPFTGQPFFVVACTKDSKLNDEVWSDVAVVSP
jgi:hypothetical protein